MPPRQTPPPTGKPRRRQGPVMPGSWIWLVMLAMIVGMFLFSQPSNGGTIDYSDFLQLVYNKELTKDLSKITFIGSQRIVGELKTTENLPEELKKQVGSSKKFSTLRPPVEDPNLMAQLLKRAEDKDHPLKFVTE